jgi:polyphosphate glucokinase
MLTLCIDVGGSGIKGSVYDTLGKPVTERIRIATPRPATPATVVPVIAEIARQAGPFDRISCGFPGVVQEGVTKTAPNLDDGWAGFPLALKLEELLGKPARAANDANVQGLAVIEGRGVEMVLTLGTGMGCGLYTDGHCCWNLELAHHTYDGETTYEDRIDDATRKRIGNKKWRKRVHAIIGRLEPIFNFRKLYLGGGNAARLDPKELPDNVVIVDNTAGMLGGLKLWAR